MYSTIYTTFKDIEEAEKITLILLQKKLVACCNTFPVSSKYPWKGQIENSNEIACLMKAKTSNFKEIEQEVKKHHSYDVPCITRYNIEEGNKTYLDWVNEETK